MKLCLLSLWYFRKVCSSKVYKPSQEDFLNVILAFPRLLRKDEKKSVASHARKFTTPLQPKAGLKKEKLCNQLFLLSWVLNPTGKQ